jgi:uncharacterized membrane protein YfcA
LIQHSSESNRRSEYQLQLGFRTATKSPIEVGTLNAGLNTKGILTCQFFVATVVGIPKMNSTLLHGIIMFAAAFVGSVMNSIAGGGTLLTFPLLIWLGLDPKIANATSTVGLWPGLFGGLFGFRKELEKSSAILIRLGIMSVIGGFVGGLLLIVTPSPTFARLAPFLILFATLLFMTQGTIIRWLQLQPLATEPHVTWWVGAMVFQFFSAIYGGYFGAGNSILILAALGLLGLHDLHRANGIKNFLGICINSIVVLSFSISHLVVWRDALVMAVGALLGGYCGASLAMRFGQSWVRRGIVLIGFAIFFVMIWRLRR